MADQNFNEEKNNKVNNLDIRERNDWATTKSDFNEETAAEVTPNLGVTGQRTFGGTMNDVGEESGGRVMGAIALALSLLSLFYLPILFGAAGIIIGFIARRRGANGLGNWAIGIGVVSMIIALFIAPFFY